MKKKSKLKNASKAAREVSKFNKAIGLRIKTLSERRGGTTISLAKAVGVSQAQISRLQNGLQGFRSGTLVKIAKALGVNPKELLSG